MKDGKHILTRDAYIDVKIDDVKKPHKFRKGLVIEWSATKKAYVVVNPQNEQEELLVLNESGYESLRGTKSIVSSKVQEELKSVKGKSNVELEKRLAQMTSKVAEQDATIESQKKTISDLQSSLDALMGAQSDDDSSVDLDEDGYLLTDEDLEKMGFDELKQVAIEEEIDITGLNSKDKLREAIISSW